MFTGDTFNSPNTELLHRQLTDQDHILPRQMPMIQRSVDGLNKKFATMFAMIHMAPRSVETILNNVLTILPQKELTIRILTNNIYPSPRPSHDTITTKNTQKQKTKTT
jgi:hypothetical protein